MCGPSRPRPKQWGHENCCGCHGRRFLSPDEERQLLEEYREQLKKEQEGLEARLKELE